MVLLAAPLAAEAQPAGRIYRIGFLGATSPSDYASQVEAFREGLRGLGYVEGKNFVIEFRWAEGKYARLPELAVDLVRVEPDVLVTHDAAVLGGDGCDSPGRSGSGQWQRSMGIDR